VARVRVARHATSHGSAERAADSSTRLSLLFKDGAAQQGVEADEARYTSELRSLTPVLSGQS